AVEAKEKIIVGVNEFTIEGQPPKTLYIDESVARDQSAKLKILRQRRSNDDVRRKLDDLKNQPRRTCTPAQTATSLKRTPCPISSTLSARTRPSVKSARRCGRFTALIPKSA